MKKVQTDCRHYAGDKPCTFSKQNRVKCGTCGCYEKKGRRVLIIKLGAPGDVLRTTPLLPEIRRNDPDSHITWITEPSSIPLLQGNPFIDRLWDTSPETIARLHVETFDLIFSLENAGKCAALASMARGAVKLGYGLTDDGEIVPLNPEADHYLEMAVFDDVKKANQRTYQDLIFELCGYRFDPEFHRITLPLSLAEQEFAAEFSRQHLITRGELVVGINIGSGGRWPMKRWLMERYALLAERLVSEAGARVIILGGPEEVERSRELRGLLEQRGIEVIDGRCDNTIRQFIAIVDLCDTVVTGDTLALHIAVALDKRVVALFGPTSATEIELYGNGAKVVAPVECQCCYLKECDVSPTCMEMISVEDVFRALNSLSGNPFQVIADLVNLRSVSASAAR